MLPPQAYGFLFKWECVLDGLLDLNQRSWEAVAKDNGHEMPDEDDVMRAWGMRALNLRRVISQSAGGR